MTMTDRVFAYLDAGRVATLEELMREFDLTKRAAESCLQRLWRTERLARSRNPTGRYTSPRHAFLLEIQEPMQPWGVQQEDTPRAPVITERQQAIKDLLDVLESFALAEARRGNIGVSNILRKVIAKADELCAM